MKATAGIIALFLGFARSDETNPRRQLKGNKKSGGYPIRRRPIEPWQDAECWQPPPQYPPVRQCPRCRHLQEEAAVPPEDIEETEWTPGILKKKLADISFSKPIEELTAEELLEEIDGLVWEEIGPPPSEEEFPEELSSEEEEINERNLFIFHGGYGGYGRPYGGYGGYGGYGRSPYGYGRGYYGGYYGRPWRRFY